MRILGLDLGRHGSAKGKAPLTLVRLDEAGRLAEAVRPGSLPEVAAAVRPLVGDGPFLLGVNAAVVVPAKTARARPVENLVRRRFGVRLPRGGRQAPSQGPPRLAGEALLAGLATAGLPCLPYPDRDARKSGLAETYPALTLKVLLWQRSSLARTADRAVREELFRAFAAPARYRAAEQPARKGWADQAVALDWVLRALEAVEEFDGAPAREALARAGDVGDVETAASLLDALLIAGAARRYLTAPEESLFLGDQEQGYVILPADGFIRGLALGTVRPRGAKLFPRASLRERLGKDAEIRALDLLPVPRRPARVEASFLRRPRLEFDNVDEMLWWKHCRQVSGPPLPVEGLAEMTVELHPEGRRQRRTPPLRLVRSRHRTLSFRFDPPASWRAHLPTRDGRTYGFEVLRAVYDTLPAER